MVIGLDTTNEAFRGEVRSFLRDNLPSDIAARTRRAVHPIREDVLAWTRILYRKGWSGGTWPKEYGGSGWTAIQNHIFDDESYQASAPRLCSPAFRLIGPVIYTFGSEAQKQRFLPPILKGEVYWAQGFSEAEAGSDLFSLRTRAERQGDHYVINGSKIWTSFAHISDFIFVLLRTKQNAVHEESFSFIVVPTNATGLRIRPIISIDDGHGLNEVFFDNVRVPADHLLGEEGKGYAYAKFLLENERTTVAPLARRYLGWIKEIAGRERYRGRLLIDNPLFACRVAQHEVDLIALDVALVNAMQEAGTNRRPASASVIMLMMGEVFGQLGNSLLDATSPYSEVFYPHPEQEAEGAPPLRVGPDSHRAITSEVLYRRHATIAGGSAEIQRNIIAKIVLRLDETALRDELDSEDELLRDSVYRFVKKNYDFFEHQHVRRQSGDTSRQIWSAYAEMGWLGAALPQDVGGSGGTLKHVALIPRALSRGLIAQPYISIGVLTGEFLSDLLPEGRCGELISPLISGQSLAVLAHNESSARGLIGYVETTAKRTGSEYVLQGRKAVIRDANAADRLIVTARLSGDATHTGGIAVFLVDPATLRLERVSYRTIDGGYAADIAFNGVRVDEAALLASGQAVYDALETAHDAATIACCSEAVGLMEWALFLARDHLKNRRQFGQLLADFQALRHRLADMYVAFEEARFMLVHTLRVWDAADRLARKQLVSACKIKIGQCGKFVAGQAIQIHGGIGMTDEYPVAHIYKRICVIDRQFGTPDFHLEEFAARSRQHDLKIGKVG